MSEIFPLEVRAKAIAVFFAIAQCFGALGPVIYGALIGEGEDRAPLFVGYLLGAGVMIVGGLVAAAIGVSAEGKSLEDVATPLSARRPGTRGRGRPARPDPYVPAAPHLVEVGGRSRSCCCGVRPSGRRRIR